MRDELASIWKSINEFDIPKDFKELFGSCFDYERSCFEIQETYILDFKDRAPRKFTSDYGASIIRLALAFYNSFGGLIVFGINDKDKMPSGFDVSFDIESFNSCLKEFSGVKFEALSRSFEIERSGEKFSITVVLIPRRGAVRPARLLKPLAKYPAGRLWIRERHEVLAANSEHLPVVYSQRDVYPSDDGVASSIQRSMPPKPATIKTFVGREEILQNLWEWFIFGDQPRTYLHGPGGSGKSAIAYEFADSVCSTDSPIFFPNGDRLDYVVYLSSKETELDTQTGKIRQFDLNQFSDTVGMYRCILIESGLFSFQDVEGLDEEDLEEKIEELFDTYSGLVVLDDIDALIRKGLDTGEEFIFMKILSASKRTRVIYTLRQIPQHARRSAIPVPGLKDEEFYEFIDVAQRQFDIVAPNGTEIPIIQSVTNSLPLLIENVLGLRKFCGSYREAIRQHESKGGDDARRYLYQREYDHLEKHGRSREVLAALALLRDAVRFTTLADIMDFSRQVVIDAFSECANIFLISEEDSAGETVYQLSPVARPFIEEVSKGLTYFDQIKRKVELFRRDDASPEETSMIIRLERLLRSEQYQAAVGAWEAIGPEDTLKANPALRALAGRAYANIGSHQRIKAVECFQYAESMNYFDIAMMRSWYFAESRGGAPIERVQQVCLKVIERPNVAVKFRAEFYNKLGSSLLREARALQFGVRDRALPLFAGALKAFMKNLYLAQVNGLQSGKAPYLLASTCFDFMAACRGDLNEFFRALEALTDEKHDVAVEGAEILVEALRSGNHLPFSEPGKRAMLGQMRRTRNRFSKAVVAISKGPGGMYLMDAFDRLESVIEA